MQNSSGITIFTEVTQDKKAFKIPSAVESIKREQSSRNARSLGLNTCAIMKYK